MQKNTKKIRKHYKIEWWLNHWPFTHIYYHLLFRSFEWSALDVQSNTTDNYDDTISVNHTLLTSFTTETIWAGTRVLFVYICLCTCSSILTWVDVTVQSYKAYTRSFKITVHQAILLISLIKKHYEQKKLYFKK